MKGEGDNSPIRDSLTQSSLIRLSYSGIVGSEQRKSLTQSSLIRFDRAKHQDFSLNMPSIKQENSIVMRSQLRQRSNYDEYQKASPLRASTRSESSSNREFSSQAASQSQQPQDFDPQNTRLEYPRIHGPASLIVHSHQSGIREGLMEMAFQSDPSIKKEITVACIKSHLWKDKTTNGSSGGMLTSSKDRPKPQWADS